MSDEQERTEGRRIAGFCPMGCGETLFRGSGGYVTCSWIECPRPDAAADILADRESEQVVTLEDFDFTVRHPLRERLDDALMDCSLHHWLSSRSGPPAKVGRYRVYLRDTPGRAVWEALATPQLEGTQP